MKYDICAPDGSVGTLVRAEVAFDQVDVESVEALTSPRREVVENADVVAIVQKATDKMVADEATSAGDEGAHPLGPGHEFG
jgi:hypothetical protein